MTSYHANKMGKKPTTMTREDISEIHSLLYYNSFRQMWYSKKGYYDDYHLFVHSNAIMVNPNVEEIKKLIGDKYSVSGDTNSETITIK